MRNCVNELQNINIDQIEQKLKYDDPGELEHIVFLKSKNEKKDMMSYNPTIQQGIGMCDDLPDYDTKKEDNIALQGESDTNEGGACGEGEDSDEEDTGEEETFEALRDQMLEFNPNLILEISLDEICSTIDYLFGFWCHDYEIMKLHERNLVFFGESSQVLERFRTYSRIAIMLDKKLTCMLEDVEADVDIETVNKYKDKISMISANIIWGYDSMVQTYRQMFCNDPSLLASLPPIKIDAFFQPFVTEKMKNHQKLLRFYLEECARRGYRKNGSALYAPKFTETGHFTRTYTFACDIIVFIYDAIYPFEQHGFLFSALTERSSVARLCADYLEKCKEDNLPVLMKDRTKFSFKNGLFDAATNSFFEYGTETNWKEDVVCANYIDLDFEDDLYCECDDPMEISTPSIQKILDDQDFEKEVCMWFYASIGRMIFSVGQMDNWQYFPFCKGTAGSGKSTLLSVASRFYNETDVGTLMSEAQKTFSVEHLFDKYVFFSYDVDEKMNFSPTRWNQMVSGELVAVERKFKVPIQQKWTAAGAFAGNSYPPWVDQAGNISRRMLIFLFSKGVGKIDTQLQSKCESELAAFMKKCVSCYHLMISRHGHKGIWDSGVLPQYFNTTRRQMQSETNPLQAFLLSDQCIIGEQCKVTFEEFRNAYKMYCETSGLPKKRLTKDFCANVFKLSDITWVKCFDVECLNGVELR